MINILLSGIVVFITHTIEAITGFGCAVLAMPFVTALLGMQTGVMVITILAWILALYFVITKWHLIDWKQYLIIIAFMLCGLPIGMYLFRNIDGALLKMVLAVFICIVSLWQLLRLVLEKQTNTKKQPNRIINILYYILLFLGGIVHGMFSSGGPLVVLYASKHLPDKGKFRSTLCLVWTTLNTIIISGYLLDNMMTPAIWETTGMLVVYVILGIIVGEKIHDKVHKRTFSIIVFCMLLLTGIFMLAS